MPDLVNIAVFDRASCLGGNMAGKSLGLKLEALLMDMIAKHQVQSGLGLLTLRAYCYRQTDNWLKQKCFSILDVIHRLIQSVKLMFYTEACSALRK